MQTERTCVVDVTGTPSTNSVVQFLFRIKERYKYYWNPFQDNGTGWIEDSPEQQEKNRRYSEQANKGR